MEQLTKRFFIRNIICTANNFYADGCYGFDALASLTVLSLKEKYPQIKLHLILPCSNAEQTNTLSAEQASEFQQILSCADSVEYTSKKYYNGGMKGLMLGLWNMLLNVVSAIIMSMIIKAVPDRQ